MRAGSLVWKLLAAQTHPHALSSTVGGSEAFRLANTRKNDPPALILRPAMISDVTDYCGSNSWNPPIMS